MVQGGVRGDRSGAAFLLFHYVVHRQSASTACTPAFACAALPSPEPAVLASSC